MHLQPILSPYVQFFITEFISVVTKVICAEKNIGVISEI
jgi:hypothetical protein